MINLKNLVGDWSNYKGAWILYQDFGRTQIGRITTIGASTIYAVFSCDGNWNEFEKYTAEGCDPEDVTFLNADYAVNGLPVISEGKFQPKTPDEVLNDLDILRSKGKTFFYRHGENVFETTKVLTEPEYDTMIEDVQNKEMNFVETFSTFDYRFICGYEFRTDVLGSTLSKKIFTFEEYLLFQLDAQKDEIKKYYSSLSEILETIYEDHYSQMVKSAGIKDETGLSTIVYLQNPITNEVFEVKKLNNGEMMKAVFAEFYKYKRTANKSKGEKAGSNFLPYKTAKENGFELED